MRSDLNRRAVLSGLASTSVPTLAHAGGSYVNEKATDRDGAVAASGAKWLMSTFGDVLTAKSEGTPFSTSIFCAVAYQESGYAWFSRKVRDGRTPSEILRLLALDPTSPRQRFPKDTPSFLADPRFKTISDELIQASVASRKARGLFETGLLMYGYGLFQNDLQNILTKPKFWTDPAPSGEAKAAGLHGAWGDIEVSTDYFISMLNDKYKQVGHDVWRAIKAYNGTGPSAEIYMENVQLYEGWIARAGI